MQNEQDAVNVSDVCYTILIKFDRKTAKAFNSNAVSPRTQFMQISTA